MGTWLGEMAAFGTAFGWGVSAQVHGTVGRIVGVSSITLLRPPIHVCMLALLCLVTGVDTSLTLTAFGSLVIAALTGIAIGDFVLYQCIQMLGARVGILLQSLCAGITAMLGVLFLGEALSPQLMGGIALATCGVGVVVTEGDFSPAPGQAPPSRKELLLGILLGLASALLLAVSFIFLKIAMHEGTSPLWSTFIRLSLSVLMLWGVGLFQGWSAGALAQLRAHPKVLWVLAGAGFFSVGGAWCSATALLHTRAGIAATIMGLQPVMVMLVASVWERRMPSLRAVLGTLVAFAGTALLCLQ